MKLGKTKFQTADKTVDWIVLFPEYREEEEMIRSILKVGKIKGELRCMPISEQYYINLEVDEDGG